MKSLRRSLLTSIVIGCCFGAISRGQSQQPVPVASGGDSAQLKVLLERVGERVQKYHDGMLNVAFTEIVRQQELQSDAAPKGKPKEFVYESVVINKQSAADQQNVYQTVTRKLTSIDGKTVEPGGRVEPSGRAKCGNTDPPPVYGNPLLFLLPNNQTRYSFYYEGEADLQERKTAVINVAPPPTHEPPQVKWEGNCYYLAGLQTKGRIWIDPNTYDVLQLQWQLAAPVVYKMSMRFVRSGLLFGFVPPRELRYEKLDTTIRFQLVTFQNPAQTLLLPMSSESMRVIKGGRPPGFLTTQSYTNYKRFLTSVQIKDADEDKN